MKIEMRRIKSRLVTFGLLCLISLSASALSVWKVNVEPVNQSGYYNIDLDQHMIGLSSDDFLLKLRVLNGDSLQVPFFVQPNASEFDVSTDYFRNYPIIDRAFTDSLNIVVFENRNKEDIDRISLVINRSNVSKWVKVQGSNDMKQWYAVKDKHLNPYEVDIVSRPSSQLLQVHFPKGNFSFYKITLGNDSADPIEIEELGRIYSSRIATEYADMPTIDFVQKDSVNKKSYLFFPELKTPLRVSKFILNVESEGMFARRAILYSEFGEKLEILNLVSSNSKGASTSVSSISTLITFPANCYLEIENEDNPPLKIQSVSLKGKSQYLCAFLKKGESYRVVLDERNESSPNYDINSFSSEIGQDLPLVSTTDFVKALEIKLEPKPIAILWFEKPVFMWSCILLVGAFLLLICIMVLKEMNKKESK